MKRSVTKQLLPIVLVLFASTAQAGVFGVGLNIHLGEPAYRDRPIAPVYGPSVQVYQPQVVRYPEVEQIRFVYPEPLGFYVAIGVPYDLCYVRGSYYLFRDGNWLRSGSSHGPWLPQRYRELPFELRNRRIEHIRSYRHDCDRGDGRSRELRRFEARELEQHDGRRVYWREARLDDHLQMSDDRFDRRR